MAARGAAVEDRLAPVHGGDDAVTSAGTPYVLGAKLPARGRASGAVPAGQREVLQPDRDRRNATRQPARMWRRRALRLGDLDRRQQPAHSDLVEDQRRQPGWRDRGHHRRQAAGSDRRRPDTGGRGEYANAIVALDPKTLQPTDWFTAPNADFITTPVIFTVGTLQLVAAATRDGRVLVLDAASLGGANHSTPLFASTSHGELHPRRARDVGGSRERWLLVPSDGHRCLSRGGFRWATVADAGAGRRVRIRAERTDCRQRRCVRRSQRTAKWPRHALCV